MPALVALARLMPALAIRVAHAKKLALVGLGCALGALLCELSLGVFGYVGASERARSVFDARYGNVPRDSWIWSFAIDPRRHSGVDLLGQLVPLAKAPGETRVLFLGDSATQGAFVRLSQSYPLVFKARLDQRNPQNQVRVVNAGVWGMTTIDEYHLLADKLLPLHPDVVVVGLFMANDLNFNLAHKEHRSAPHRKSLTAQLAEHSALAHFLRLQALAWNARLHLVQSTPEQESLLPVEIGLVDSFGLHLLSYSAGELATYERQPSTLVNHAFEVLERALRNLIVLGKTEHFSLRVLLIPSPSRVFGRLAILHHPKVLEELAAEGTQIALSDLDFDAPTARVLSICEKLDLACVDPTERFRRLGANAFFSGDEHPSVLGHEALAAALLAP